MAIEIREAYGRALTKYGEINKNVVVLDADVSSSTKSAIFAARFPERFFNVGIAEANMTAMAAGMAAEGMIPFVNTFAVFLTSIGLTAARLCGSYSRANIKLMGAYGGLSDSFDGPTHHALEDVAIMRALPDFSVFVPSDAVQTDWLVKHAIETDAPMYIRLSRAAFSDVYSAGREFAAGRGEILREGSDAAIIACGGMVSAALKSAEKLAQEGIQARVVDMFTIKPIDTALVLDCASLGAIVTAEEHSVIGGLGSAVAEVLSQHGAAAVQGFIGVNDTHAECGGYAELLSKYELDEPAITAKVKKTLMMKGK